MRRDETRIYDQEHPRGPLLKGKSLTLFWLGVNLEYIRLASLHRYYVKEKNYILDNLRYAKEKALFLHLWINIPESLSYWIKYLDRTYASKKERIEEADGDTLFKEIGNMKSFIYQNLHAPDWYAFRLGVNSQYLKRAAFHKYFVLKENYILTSLKRVKENLENLKISGEPMNVIDYWIRYLGGRYRIPGENISDIDGNNLYNEMGNLIDLLGG